MWARFLDIFFPSLCEICHSSLKSGRSLCEGCRDSLPKIADPFCQTCGEGFEGNITEPFKCPNCHKLTFSFDFARAALQSSDDGRFLIHQFKYRRHFYLASEFSSLIQECLTQDLRLSAITEPVLVPVPLHWWREQKRTSNQAYEIARQLSRDLNVPIYKALKRRRHTTTQTKLPRKLRLKNLKGAFTLRKGFHDTLSKKTVFLIDDVFTTGATAHECSKILKKEAQVARIIVITLMRG